jgi:hypothetical protein
MSTEEDDFCHLYLYTDTGVVNQIINKLKKDPNDYSTHYFELLNVVYKKYFDATSNDILKHFNVKSEKLFQLMRTCAVLYNFHPLLTNAIDKAVGNDINYIKEFLIENMPYELVR